MLQWDKDDCAATGLVKFDLLGLGMLSALATTPSISIASNTSSGRSIWPPSRRTHAVYDIVVRGRFHRGVPGGVTGPRWPPCPGCGLAVKFYDLVVEVALIRPGPIQGGSVHPFIRRRNGLEEPVTYLHPLLENSALKKTLGVPLFQEQLMQIAMDVAVASAPAEADQFAPGHGLQAQPVNAWNSLHRRKLRTGAWPSGG